MIVNRAAPLYVEFAGLPGVGKSTVCTQVLHALNAGGLRCGVQAALGNRVRGPDGVHDFDGRHWQRRSTAERAATYALLHARQWRVAVPGLRLALQRPQGAAEIVVRMRRLVLQLERIRNAIERVRADDSDVVVFNQGVLLCMREIAVATGAKRAVGLGPLADAVVHALGGARFMLIVLRADVDSIVERIRSRPGTPGAYDRMSPARARAALIRQAPWLDLLAQHMSASGHTEEVVELDATLPPEASARIATSRVLRALAAPPQGTVEAVGAA